MEAHSLNESELTRFETNTGLERSLDLNFRRIVDKAREEWARRFSGSEPSDACVSVHITAMDAKAVRGSDFVKSNGKLPPPRRRKFALPGFAH